MAESNQLETIDLLLVDDRAENLFALESVLACPGYNLIKVHSGDEALRYLLDHDPGLILMDVQMPELDGFETAAIIKRSERTREIPIIFITAINKDERYVHKGYDHGAVDYLYKPYDAHILKSKVAVFVELARKTRRLLRAEKQLRENERKERERQLVQLELKNLRREQADQKRYRELVDGINHGIVWSASPDSLAISFVSQSAERILGYPLEQWSVEGGFLLKHVHPDDREKLAAALHLAQSGGKDVGLEHRFIAADGREVWLHSGIRFSAGDYENGHELRGLSVDISKLKEAEETLRQNKNRSDFLAEASLHLFETLDYESTLSRIGKLAVSKLADWYAVDILHEQVQIKTLSVVHADPQKKELAREFLRRYPFDLNSNFGVPKVLRSGQPELYRRISEELLCELAQNEDHLRRLRDFGLQSALFVPLIVRGETRGVMTLITAESGRHYDDADLATVEDLARRAAIAIDNANLYKQAQEAIRARDEFLSIASHELKTPITPLKIQTQALLRTLRTGVLADIKPERVVKMIQTSDRQLGRLSKLVDNLLDISRINVGKLDLNIEEFDLIELVRDVVERFSGPLASAKCDVEFDSVEHLLVQWDRFRIEQVVINLLTNALKYGPGKPICITAARQGDSVKLTLSDQGIGIAKKDQERVFGRFERAVSGNNFGGLGLGLYIVSQILEIHGGKISVQSEIGMGSTFVVELPLKVPEQKVALADSSA